MPCAQGRSPHGSARQPFGPSGPSGKVSPGGTRSGAGTGICQTGPPPCSFPPRAREADLRRPLPFTRSRSSVIRQMSAPFFQEKRARPRCFLQATQKADLREKRKRADSAGSSGLLHQARPLGRGQLDPRSPQQAVINFIMRDRDTARAGQVMAFGPGAGFAGRQVEIGLKLSALCCSSPRSMPCWTPPADYA